MRPQPTWHVGSGCKVNIVSKAKLVAASVLMFARNVACRSVQRQWSVEIQTNTGQESPVRNQDVSRVPSNFCTIVRDCSLLQLHLPIVIRDCWKNLPNSSQEKERSTGYWTHPKHYLKPYPDDIIRSQQNNNNKKKAMYTNRRVG